MIALTVYLLIGADYTETEDTADMRPEISIEGESQVGEELALTAEVKESQSKEYEWEILETDGGNQISTERGKSITHRFNRPGDKTIRLEVENEQGQKQQTHEKITISGGENGDFYLAHLEPREDDRLDGPKESFEFYAEAPDEGYRYELEVGQETSVSGELREGSQTVEEEVKINRSGEDMDYTVFILDDEGNTRASQTQSIQVGRSWNEFGNFEVIEPSQDYRTDHHIFLEMDISDLADNVELKLFLDGEEQWSQSISGEWDGEFRNRVDTFTGGQFDYKIVADLYTTKEEKVLEEGEVEIEYGRLADYSLVKPEAEIFDTGEEITFEADFHDTSQESTVEFYVTNHPDGTMVHQEVVDEGFSGTVTGEYIFENQTNEMWWLEVHGHESGEEQHSRFDQIRVR